MILENNIVSLSGNQLELIPKQTKNIQSVNWSFRSTDLAQILILASKTYECPWVGFGIYTCQIRFTDEGLMADFRTFSKDFSGLAEEALPQSGATHTIEPDQTLYYKAKLPSTKKLKQLVKAESWKELAVIHNDNALSDAYFCCPSPELKQFWCTYLKLPYHGD